MSGKTIQRCDECNDPTCAAGSEDELSVETPNGDKFGPLCPTCYDRIRELNPEKEEQPK